MNIDVGVRLLRTLKTLGIAIGLASPSSAVAQEAPISIVCRGDNLSSDENCVFGQNSQMSCWSTPTRTVAEVFVQIDQDSGRVRIPTNVFNVRGDGWIEIYDLDVGQQLITGRLSLSALTKPRLKIDRYAGTIDIHSSSLIGTSFSFSGHCQRYELQGQRF